jgi:hypothetical protein
MQSSVQIDSLPSSAETMVPRRRGFKLVAVATIGVIALTAVSTIYWRRSSEDKVVDAGQSFEFQGLATSDCINNAWSQCGGKGFTGKTCCPAGSTCSAQSEYYSQCIPSGYPTFPPFTPQPTASTPAPTSATPAPTPVPTQSGCVADWRQCGGVSFSGPTCCSIKTSFCSKQSDWYSQCLPAGSAPFPLVDYTFEQVSGGKVLNPITAYTGLVSGGVTVVSGYQGQAVQFNNVDGVVVVNNSASWDFSNTGFTLEARVYRFGSSGEDGIITKWYGPDSFLLKFEDNSLKFDINFVTAGVKEVNYSFTNTSYLNKWNFVKASYDVSGTNGVMRLWWNGILVNSKSVQKLTIQPSSVLVHVGNTNNAWSDFNGKIDSVRIWNTAV